jgi:molybdopterin converting factor small subunit
MAKVTIWGSLREAAGDRAEVEVAAGNVRELLTKLGQQYPAMRPQLDRGVSVSIDGTLYPNAWLTEIRPDSEVVLLPKVAGG